MALFVTADIFIYDIQALSRCNQFVHTKTSVTFLILRVKYIVRVFSVHCLKPMYASLKTRTLKPRKPVSITVGTLEDNKAIATSQVIIFE